MTNTTKLQINGVIVYDFHAHSVNPNRTLKDNLKTLDNHKRMQILDSENDMLKSLCYCKRAAI